MTSWREDGGRPPCPGIYVANKAQMKSLPCGSDCSLCLKVNVLKLCPDCKYPHRRKHSGKCDNPHCHHQFIVKTERQKKMERAVKEQGNAEQLTSFTTTSVIAASRGVPQSSQPGMVRV